MSELFTQNIEIFLLIQEGKGDELDCLREALELEERVEILSSKKEVTGCKYP